jgi:hypothetical protein
VGHPPQRRVNAVLLCGRFRGELHRLRPPYDLLDGREVGERVGGDLKVGELPGGDEDSRLQSADCLVVPGHRGTKGTSQSLDMAGEGSEALVEFAP